MFAAANNHAACIPLLLGELRMRNANGDTALHLAVRKGHVECASLLLGEADIKNNDRKTPLDLATGTCKQLIQMYQSKPKSADDWVLHAANGNHPVVKKYVKQFAGQADAGGWTALMQAVRCGYKECFDLLLDTERGKQN